MSLHLGAMVLAVLWASVDAFVPAKMAFPMRIVCSADSGCSCARMRVCGADGDVPDTVRRRIVTGSAAVYLASGLPAQSNALFGIGEPFQVYQEEDTTEEEDENYPVYGSRSIMAKKRHGTSDTPVMKNLRWGCDYKLADQICNYNRHFAENAGYFRKTSWLKDVDETEETTYYDSVTGKPLFIAPRGRTFPEFVKESKVHGWPSFRDEEVVWENVRCLRDGECVSLTGWVFRELLCVFH